MTFVEELTKFLNNSSEETYIWGNGLRGRALYAGIRRLGLEKKINGFIDSNARLNNSTFLGKKIIKPKLNKNFKIINCVSKFGGEITKYFKSDDILDTNEFSDLGHWSIELMDVCNLKCPSCPRGNYEKIKNEKNYMDVSNFQEIVNHIEKIDKMSSYIALYNWGDPLLHPKLHKIFEYLNKKKYYVALSSNLSMPKPNLSLIAKKIKCGELRISLSGFTQETYGKTHNKGNIELVKENMILLSRELKNKNNKDIQVKVVYHIYKHNIHEVELMKKFSENLNFTFDPIKAILFPVEHLINYVERGTTSSIEFNSMVDNMLEPVNQVLARGASSSKKCKFWDQHDIMVDGSVNLCCITYDNFKNRAANDILNITDSNELTTRKRNHPTCIKCMNYNIDQFVWGDLWSEKA